MGNQGSQAEPAVAQGRPTSRRRPAGNETIEINGLKVRVTRDRESNQVYELSTTYKMQDLPGWEEFRKCLRNQASNLKLPTRRTVIDVTSCRIEDQKGTNQVNTIMLNFIRDKVCNELKSMVNGNNAKRLFDMALVSMDLVVDPVSTDENSVVSSGYNVHGSKVWTFMFHVLPDNDTDLEENRLNGYDATRDMKIVANNGQSVRAHLRLTLVSVDAFQDEKSVADIITEFNEDRPLEEKGSIVGSLMAEQGITPVSPAIDARGIAIDQDKMKFSRLSEEFGVQINVKSCHAHSIETVDKKWIQEYESQGYNIIRGFLEAPEKMRQMFTECSRAVRWQGIFNETVRLRVGQEKSKRLYTKLPENHPMADRVKCLIDRISDGGLRIGQQVVIKSTENCSKQAWHTDYHIEQVKPIAMKMKPASVLIALSNYGADLWLWTPEEKKKFKIHINKGDALVFRGDTVHAGAEYDAELLKKAGDIYNVRYHAFFDSNDPNIVFKSDTTYPFKSLISEDLGLLGLTSDEAAIAELMRNDEHIVQDRFKPWEAQGGVKVSREMQIENEDDCQRPTKRSRQEITSSDD